MRHSMSRFQNGKLLSKFAKLQRCFHLLRGISILEILITHSLGALTKDIIFEWIHLSPEIYVAGTQKADMHVKLWYWANHFSVVALSYPFFYFYFFKCLFNFEIQKREGEREREKASGGGAESEGETENPKQAPHCQCKARFRAWTHKLWDHDLSWSQTLNQLSHSGAHHTPPLPATNSLKRGNM